MSRTTTVVGPEAAAEVLGVIQAAFGARPPLDPPAPALLETLESVAAALATDGGLLLTENGVALGSLMFRREGDRSEEHTSELQSLMRISYAVFCLKKKINK